MKNTKLRCYSDLTRHITPSFRYLRNAKIDLENNKDVFQLASLINKIELKVNKDVIKKVERTEDGWYSLRFRPPHPIPPEKEDWECSFSLCDTKIKKGQQYVIESTSEGNPKKWHLLCYDLFISRMRTDPTRPDEIDKLKYDYWFKNREGMIKVR